MIDINEILKEKLKQKTNKGIKLKLEITIDENEDSLLYDYFFKYISIMNKTKYINVEKSTEDGQSIVMARHKGEHFKNLLYSILKSKEGYKLIQDMELGYKEYFEKLEDEKYIEQLETKIKKEDIKKDDIVIHKNQSTIYDIPNNNPLETKEEKPRLNLLLKKED